LDHGVRIGVGDIEISVGTKAGSQGERDVWPKLANKGASGGVIFQYLFVTRTEEIADKKVVGQAWTGKGPEADEQTREQCAEMPREFRVPLGHKISFGVARFCHRNVLSFYTGGEAVQVTEVIEARPGHCHGG
jgi:hypothetical protein